MAISNVTPYNCNFQGTVPFGNLNAKILLAANTALTWTVPGEPTQIYRATFRCSSTAEVWVCLNGTAVLPGAGTASNAPNQEFIPTEPKYLKGGDVISLISAGTPSVGIALLQLPNRQ